MRALMWEMAELHVRTPSTTREGNLHFPKKEDISGAKLYLESGCGAGSETDRKGWCVFLEPEWEDV